MSTHDHTKTRRSNNHRSVRQRDKSPTGFATFRKDDRSGVTTAVPQDGGSRRGAFMVLAFFCLIAAMSMMALGLDLGVISYTKTKMQSAVDAAALAAAQEITAAVSNVGDHGGDVSDANSIATGAAREMAEKVASMNGVFIDPERDVEFGKRIYSDQSGTFGIQWGVSPYNVVKVTARRDNIEPGHPDSQMKMFFGPVMGHQVANVVASAVAFVEARDIALVLDYSGSMNDDSSLGAIGRLSQADIEANLLDIWDALQPLNTGDLVFEPQYVRIKGEEPSSSKEPQIYVTFKGDEIFVESSKDLSNVVCEFEGSYEYKFDNLNVGQTATFKGEGSYAGMTITACWVKSGKNSSGDGPGYGERFDDDLDSVLQAFNLDSTPYPFPSGSWGDFINWNRSDNSVERAGYSRKYGGLTFMNYLLDRRAKYNQTPVLWKAPAYPFHAMKEGVTLFTNFLSDLEFDDHIGLVTYDDEARVESYLDEPEDGAHVNLGDQLITNRYADIDTIQRHKQASHYAPYTGTGYGLEQAIDLLQNHRRTGARPTILVMTDGNANRSPYGWRLPNDWDWDALTDYDGDGRADYSTNDRDKQYAFYQAKLAIDQGITIHTMTVGADADRDFMKAIAFAGSGIWMNAPGGSTISDLEEQLLAAFRTIAANVPPAKLLHDPNEL
mgnify:CR=1 FL=1